MAWDEDEEVGVSLEAAGAVWSVHLTSRPATGLVGSGALPCDCESSNTLSMIVARMCITIGALMDVSRLE